ncbi:MAG TPA: efflux RND transporter permease subunit, partial [Rhodanobacteraceae bacterium]
MRVPDFLHRPLVWGMVYAALIVWGAWAVGHIPAEVLPRFDFPQIRVIVHAPGYGVLEVESLIVRPLEAQLMGLQGMTMLHTTIDRGETELDARFTEGANPQLALQAVFGALARARARLPRGLSPHAQIMGNAINEVADYGVAVPAGIPLWQAENAVRTRILPVLRALPGVQRVELFGAGPPTLWIQPDPAAMIQHHVGVSALAQAIGHAVVLAPAGRLVLGHQDVLLELRNLPRTPKAVLTIPVPTPSGPVPVATLARVVNAPPEPHSAVELDGHPGLGLIVLKQPNASTIPVDTAVGRTLKQLRDQLPHGCRLVTVYRQAHLVSLIGRDLTRDMVIGGVLAILLLVWLLGRQHGVWV